MDFVNNLDLIFRGGIIALCALVALQLLQLRPLRSVSTFGVLFLLCTTLYTVKGMPEIEGFIGAQAFLALQFAGMLLVALFWIFVRALVLDNYRFGVTDAIVLAFNALMFFPICYFETAFNSSLKVLHLVTSLALMADALRQTLLSRKDDLVESRRTVAKAMVWIIAIVCIVISGFVVLETLQLTGAIAPALQSAVIFSTVLFFTAVVITLHENLVPMSVTAPRSIADTELPPADRLELSRLRTMMEHGVYLEPNLTIGSLAAKMHVPEHRLRKLINNHLGHRNFAAFINDQRIEEAKLRLGNSMLAREQITGLAFDLGFASLAPFNRAFRDRVGMSPSEYRTKALTLAITNESHTLHS